jgi:glycosyltransferase involved in cell wall biosynthesis
MRIAIDARELAGQRTGVGRYLSEILREWESTAGAAAHEFILCAPAEMTYSGPLRATIALEHGAGTLWEQRALPKLATRAQADVLFCPGYSGPIFDSTPLVVAIHDVSFAAHPEWFRWREGLRRRLVTRASAQRASRVLTLTEFSKREIIEHLGIPPDRVEVIHPGVRIGSLHRLRQGHGESAEASAAEEGLPNTAGVPSGISVAQPFRAAKSLVLYVGSIFNRRHVPETISAVERLARRHADVGLAIVGDNRTFPHVNVHHLARWLEVHSYVSDEHLTSLYSRARAFAFLSEYEGFGLTPLEALAAGIPVVLLDTPVAREVFGDAAIYVAQPDPRQIEVALETALYDEAVRSTVLAAARDVVARYTWAACARRVLHALVNAAR